VPTPNDLSGELPFLTRLWFAWVCLIRVLFNGTFAARVFALQAQPLSLPEKADEPRPEEKVEGLQLLALLQREGRLVDFLEQDVTTFSDQEVGAAARIVHEGCRKTLHRVTSVTPVRLESEGAKVILEAGFAPSEIVLVGNVEGTPPYRGTLRHRGWRATGLTLPALGKGHDPSVLAPAEVEL
jgi:hypothetical protein